MKKFKSNVLTIVLTSSFSLAFAQTTPKDTASIKTANIGEVVITGALGIKKKVDAQTSAQQVVSSEQLNQAANPNAVSALTGKVSGVQITQTNSSVSGDYSILIRGVRTITGNNEALVVIDNVISSANNLQQLPPEAIESINIIKGGAGAALYGSQGINGVVVVTTKRGTKSKKMTVNFNSAVDFETVAFVPERQTEYGQGWDGTKVHIENGGWGPAFNDPAYAGTSQPYGIPLYDYNGDGIINLNPNDDTPAGDEEASIFSPFKSFGNQQIKDFFQTGTIFQNSLTINAGDGDGYVLLNLNNVDRDFLVMDDTLKRTSGMFKGGIKAGKWHFDGVVNYSHQKTSQTDPDIYYQLLQSATDIPITRWRDYPDNGYAWNIYYQNPYFNIKHNRSNALRNYFNAIASAQFNLNSHINFLYRANVQFTNTETESYNDGFDNPLLDPSAGVNPIVSSYFKYNRLSQSFSGDFIASFDYDLATDLNMNLNLGHSYQEWRTNNMSSGGTGIIIPGLYQVWNLSNPSLPYSLSNGSSERNQHSLFGNLDLNYGGYLFLNAAARYELNSVLPEDERSYFYPTVGLSFVPTKAFDFMKDNSVLNYFKINASWSRVGNSSALSPYSINNIGVNGVGFPFPQYNELSFVIQRNQTDKDIRPEFTNKKELGVTLGFFKDRILFDGAIYREDTEDLITSATTSTTTGITSKLFNIGKLKGTGVEANLNLVPIKTTDFKWDLGVSYSQNKTIVEKLTDDAKSVRLAGNSFMGLYAEEGQELTILKGVAYARDDQGRVIVDPVTGVPTLATDLKNFGRVTPKYILGFTTNFSYKGIKVGAVMDYRTGHNFYSGSLQGFTFNGLSLASAGFDRSMPWIFPNSSYMSGGSYVANTDLPIYATTYNNPNSPSYSPVTGLESLFGGANYNTVGDNFVLDATAFKIREISVSYTLPRMLLANTGINELTFGVHARNPFQKYAKENKGYNDPETSFDPRYRGLANSGQYPEIKTYGANVSITF